MALSFGPWRDISEDGTAFRQLFKHDEIFEPQRRDGDQREAVDGASFPGAYLAIFSEGPEAYGFILYTPRPSGVFEQHTGFLRAFRGESAERDIAEATQRMFFETPCSQIVTFCPDWLPGTRVLAKRMGAQYLFENSLFARRDGENRAADLYGQSALQWAWQHHHEFERAGAKWHDQVFTTLEPHHEEDPAHNAMLGLALEMGKRQPHKAIAIYNAWSELAGYAPGALIWADGQGNSVFDIGVATVVNSADRVIAVFPKSPCQPRPPSQQQQEP